jgi:pimeloyl-ACP methyl ester carboxylesterase
MVTWFPVVAGRYAARPCQLAEVIRARSAYRGAMYALPTRRHRPWRPCLLAVLLAAVAFAALAGATAPAMAAPPPAKPTVVLVHGGFTDASVWARVVTRLQRRGYPVAAPANPLQGLAVDTAYLESVLAAIQGPVVLVAHGYGGMVISNAAVENPNVKALVYVAAYAPLVVGDNLLSLTLLAPGGRLPPARLGVRRAPATSTGEAFELFVPPELFHKDFAADLPARQAATMAASQRPVIKAVVTDMSGPPAWKTIPSWYLVPGRDRAIGTAAERIMARRIGATTVEVKGASHVVMLSRPDETTKLVVRAARGG